MVFNLQQWKLYLPVYCWEKKVYSLVCLMLLWLRLCLLILLVSKMIKIELIQSVFPFDFHRFVFERSAKMLKRFPLCFFIEMYSLSLNCFKAFLSLIYRLRILWCLVKMLKVFPFDLLCYIALCIWKLWFENMLCLPLYVFVFFFNVDEYLDLTHRKSVPLKHLFLMHESTRF